MPKESDGIFQVGDRVVAIKGVDGRRDLIGMTGTIVCTDYINTPPIGVEFDEVFSGGHDCRGAGKLGKCRYGYTDEFELVIEDEINPEPDETEQLDAFLSGYLN